MAKHVTFLSHTANKYGGAEAAFLEMLTYLVGKNYITADVILPESGSMEAVLRQHGINYTIIPFRPWCETQDLPRAEKELRAAIDIQATSALVRHLQRVNPDVVFTNTIVAPWLAVSAVVVGKPHVWMLHEFGDKDHGYVFDYDYTATLQVIDQLSAAVIVNSRALMKHIETIISPQKITQVYYAMASQKVPKPTPVQAFSDDPHSLKCLVVGRILEPKGQLDAVEAISKAISAGSNVELVLLGEIQSKSYAQKITAQINKHGLAKKVKLIGHSPTPQDFMYAADVILMCSQNEAFGRVTVEAMLLAKPVIGADSGATQELLQNNKTGLLYRAGDTDDLAAKIIALAADSNLGKNLGQAAKTFAEKNFNHDSYEARIMPILKTVEAVASYPLIDKFLDYTMLLEAEVATRGQQLSDTNKALEQAQMDLTHKQATLDAILSSRSWKIARGFQKSSEVAHKALHKKAKPKSN